MRQRITEDLAILQSIPGVPALHQGGSALAANPADWMLQISEPKSEDAFGVDFASVFSQSSAYRYCQIQSCFQQPCSSWQVYAASQVFSVKLPLHACLCCVQMAFALLMVLHSTHKGISCLSCCLIKAGARRKSSGHISILQIVPLHIGSYGHVSGEQQHSTLPLMLRGRCMLPLCMPVGPCR